LLDTLPQAPYSVDDKQALIASAQVFAKRWTALKPAEKIKALKMFVRRVTIGRDGIQIALKRHGLLTVFAENHKDLATRVIQDASMWEANADDIHKIQVTACLKRCGIETKLIIAERTPLTVHSRTQHALQSALAKALEWNQKLIDGKVESMAALAKQEGVTQRYIAHVIKLAFLAPDIMNAILKGRVPHDLTLTRLKKDLPLDWAQQRKIFGITA
jgi:site-specific DNA recombinase